LFQSTIPQKEWRTHLEGKRRPLGAVRAREVKDQRPAWDPRGLPKGAYMVLEFTTTFANGTKEELITMMQEQNGAWKVLTYEIK
jgi:hypothetical protein